MNEDVVMKNAFIPFNDDIINGNFVTDKTGVKTVEILGLRMELDPTHKFLNFSDIRKSPKKYIQHEIEWYDSQDLSVKEIEKHAKMWSGLCTKDDKKEINSNYGYLVYSNENGNQYDNVLKELSRNQDSRRALMIYNRPSMHTDYHRDGMSDFVCTLGQQFFIRDNKLVSLVEMRSSDMIYGFFSDFPWFSTIQERLLVDLKKVHPQLTIGKLIWISNSGHVYEQHFDTIKQMVEAHGK